MSFEHVRHKPPTALTRPRELIVVCAPLRSNVNLSNLLRTAGCCGIARVIACGNPSIHKSIARDGADQVQLDVHRSLEPVLKQLKAEGYPLIGLERRPARRICTTLNSHGRLPSSWATSASA